MSAQTVFRAAIPKQAALNIANAVSFYVQRLGFTELFQAEDYAGVRRGEVEIHLWLCDDKNIPEKTACRVQVENIEPLYAEYQGAGVIHPRSSLQETPWGTREFTILDLDGNGITFSEPL
jgi:uncharacterized glyoxalase superfamily protein PhnB